MDLLSQLTWRYATKRFSEKKLSGEQLKLLSEAARLAPSSYGLQPYKLIIVEDPEIRKKLAEVSYDQKQITEAGHLFVFARYDEIDEKDVDKHVELISNIRNKSIEELSTYSSNIKKKLTKLRKRGLLECWMARQAYLALGTIITTAAIAGIDVCPMEGIEAEKYDHILGLGKYKLKTVVICAVGFRSNEDKYSHETKVRRDTDDFLMHI